LLGEPRLAASLGAAGLDRARRRFSVAVMTARTIALYESL
jgi:hypothetical protein